MSMYLPFPKPMSAWYASGVGGTHAVRSGSSAPDVRQTHKPVEVTNLRWVVNVCQRIGGIQRVMVDGDPEGLKWRATPGNRLEPGAVAPLFLFVPSISWFGNHETRSQRSTCRGANQIATADRIL